MGPGRLTREKTNTGPAWQTASCEKYDMVRVTDDETDETVFCLKVKVSIK